MRHRLGRAVTRHYGREVRSVTRIARGFGTANWRVRGAAAEYFLKQYPLGADAAAEAAALELSRTVRAAGLPVPQVIPTVAGELLCRDGHLTLALFDDCPGAAPGVPLSRRGMVQAGRTLGRLHRCLRDRPGRCDTSAVWLALDPGRKRANFERCLEVIERKRTKDDFDRRTAPLLRRRLELLPRAAALLASLPPLASQVVHGDYNIQNLLFRDGELVAVVDFGPPDLFLPAFEIGRAALDPETVAKDPEWMAGAFAFAEACCRANPGIGRADLRFAPQVWAIQLLRSEYGVREHYFGPVERQVLLDRFWFLRCEAAETILHHLDPLSERFAAAWDAARETAG